MNKLKSLSNIETPCLLLDKETIDKNIQRLNHHIGNLGVTLRAHMKTAKSVEIANFLFEGAKGSITVSTLKEAEGFSNSGFTDIIYAVGVSPQKLDRIYAIRKNGNQLKIILDSKEQAEFVSEYVKRTGDAIEVLIEIDCDGHRSGVGPANKERLLDIAAELKRGGALLAGVLTHAGGSYSAKSKSELETAAEIERKAAVDAAVILRSAGFDCPIVSVGSTPTAHFAKDLKGVTEVRAGNFMFFDLFMAGLGICTKEDIALSVLTTVIGHQQEKGWIIVDAGWMAMSRDRSTTNQATDQGYGLVCNENGEIVIDLIMVSANQEHGILAFRNGQKCSSKEFPIGSKMRILPNHACATAAQHQQYYVIERQQIMGVWSRFNGW
jgi:D-serine deaminase-like pyridoxal phosphate-dependent protein